MRTGSEVGKLYVYFLETAARFAYHHVYKRMEIRDLVKGMHEDLVLKLVGGCHMGYINIIMKHEHFSERQTKKCPTRCHVIDKNNQILLYTFRFIHY